MLSSTSDKTLLLAENFSKNSNLDDPGISLRAFPLRTNLKLYNIPLTFKLSKKALIDLDLSNALAPEYIPAVNLKNREPELS